MVGGEGEREGEGCGEVMYGRTMTLEAIVSSTGFLTDVLLFINVLLFIHASLLFITILLYLSRSRQPPPSAD